MKLLVVLLVSLGIFAIGGGAAHADPVIPPITIPPITLPPITLPDTTTVPPDTTTLPPDPTTTTPTVTTPVTTVPPTTAPTATTVPPSTTVPTTSVTTRPTTGGPGSVPPSAPTIKGNTPVVTPSPFAAFFAAASIKNPTGGVVSSLFLRLATAIVRSGPATAAPPHPTAAAAGVVGAAKSTGGAHGSGVRTDRERNASSPTTILPTLTGTVNTGHPTDPVTELGVLALGAGIVAIGLIVVRLRPWL